MGPIQEVLDPLFNFPLFVSFISWRAWERYVIGIFYFAFVLGWWWLLPSSYACVWHDL